MSEMELMIMNIIINAGDAKTHAYEALRKVNDGDYAGAEEEMKKSEEALEVAHNAQTSLIQKEANGEKIEFSVLFVHSQDHLMTTITEKNLIEQIIELKKTINQILTKINN
ncbi:PTS system, cellobiose-specific IIA component [Clostridium sp. USBA 49]|jgi:PTS system cellobiose-specific IIA component|uniref:PTS lactose/cellobiose transporter subunit IIA n=1 Tax=Clostridium TaxID=1485 RepID=UPI00099A5C86|nr:MULTISPECIES: PTS lactose/cellobiose transporter subunit IIA [Clostridium]SKA90111.1 PTS system, cellobiose-specific IIA component [Clostridium sp. USBA 49]